MISETRLDESFPTNQFMINGFSAPFLTKTIKAVVLFYTLERIYNQV